MTPTDLITSTGLRRAAVLADTMAAMNRYELTLNPRELDTLTREQLALLLIESHQGPGDPLWLEIELRLGITITP